MASKHQPWTDEENELIRTFYPVAGARWRGWGKLFSDREVTFDSIAHQASKLKVRCTSSFRYGKGKGKAERKADAMLEDYLSGREEAVKA
jgi:hypothetical protein